tara:strand:+ start:182 stop:505 length:324 start_codon:yes stop_codon:yes gene_type:complete
MKTFQQFIEQSNDLPGVIKSLQGIAQSAKMNKQQAGNLRNAITNTVFDKLTGGAEGRKKGIDKIEGKLNKMSTDLPKAIGKFQGFLDSGKPQQGLEKLKGVLNKQLK